MARFGDFAPLCRQVPSYTWCNLFFRQVSSTGLVVSIYPHMLTVRPQMQKRDPAVLTGLSADPSSAPIGVNPACGIPRVGTSTSANGGPSGNSVGNVADIVACGLSVFFVVALIFWTNRRKAAVGECRSIFSTFPFPVVYFTARGRSRRFPD